MLLSRNSTAKVRFIFQLSKGLRCNFRIYYEYRLGYRTKIAVMAHIPMQNG